ncbi:MAG: helix-turn-helix transcriptional regulator [Chloroflexota bacterium]|nr:helix-turn-helix transcriptional regulator [Chloroflexota bacterium]
MRWEDLEQRLDAIPGVREAYELHYPYDEVALEIAGLRGQRDMTQTEFGKLVGIPQSTVARLESGQQNPSVGMLKRIAEATGTELVVEFKHPRRIRRATTPSGATASASHKRSSEPIAASPSD